MRSSTFFVYYQNTSYQPEQESYVSRHSPVPALTSALKNTSDPSVWSLLHIFGYNAI